MMARINEDNYIERRHLNQTKFGKWKNIWLGKVSHICIKVIIPERLYGKRFRLKVEEVKEYKPKKKKKLFKSQKEEIYKKSGSTRDSGSAKKAVPKVS